MLVTGEVNDKVYMYSKYIQADETFCYDKKTQVASKLLITYPANTLDIPEDAAFSIYCFRRPIMVSTSS